MNPYKRLVSLLFNEQDEEPRQQMASNDEIKKRLEKKKAMDSKIKSMFSGPSVRKPL